MRARAAFRGWMTVAVVAVATGVGAANASEANLETLAPQFLGPDGEALPFHDEAEALDFLRTARVIHSERAKGGTSGARKVLLEADGVRAHAVFRDKAVAKFFAQIEGEGFHKHFRDHYANEVAAYRLARLLGLDAVPPTVARRIDRQEGSLQLWIEGAEPEKSYLERDLGRLEWLKHRMQVDQMNVFDALIRNVDRNLGNYLTVPSGAVWWVDHTRTFSSIPEIPEMCRVERVDKDFWLRLTSLPDETIVEALSPILDEPEIEGVLERRRMIVSLLGARLEEKGPSAVLFSLAYARPSR
jgi:hypothetical protein